MPTRIVVLLGICTLVLVGLSLGGCWWVGGGRPVIGNFVGVKLWIHQVRALTMCQWL